MVQILSAVAVYVVAQPVDMRKGVDGLAAHVTQQLGRAIAPCEGYVLINSSGSRIALLLYDANGVSLLKRTLHHGGFSSLSSSASCANISCLSPNQQPVFDALFIGLKWQKMLAEFTLKIHS